MSSFLSKQCESCGEQHKLYLPIGTIDHIEKQYEYLCPISADVVQLVVVDVDRWETVDERPDGSIVVTVVTVS